MKKVLTYVCTLGFVAVVVWLLIPVSFVALPNEEAGEKAKVTAPIGSPKQEVDNQIALLPSELLLTGVPYHHYYFDRVFQGSVNYFLTITRYFEIPQLSREQAQERLPERRMSLRELESVLVDRNYEVLREQLPATQEGIDQIKFLLHTYQAPLYLVNHKLDASERVEELDIVANRIIVGYSDSEVAANHSLFRGTDPGYFVMHDLQLGNALEISYESVMQLALDGVLEVMIAWPKNIVPEFEFLREQDQPYPELLSIWKDQEIIESVVLGSIVGTLEASPTAQTSEVLEARAQWVESPGFKKYHPLHRYFQSFDTAKVFQDVGDYETAREVLASITIPATRVPGYDSDAFLDWTVFERDQSVDQYQSALLFHMLMSLALNDTAEFEERAAELEQHNGTTRKDLKNILLEFLVRAPTYNIQHLKPVIEEL